MRFALADNSGLGEVKIVPTPSTFAEALQEIEQAAKYFRSRGEIIAVAGGVAGTFDSSCEKLLSAPHLPEWVNQPLREILEKQFGCPVYLENDTALVGLGEVQVGAGRGYGVVAYISVSTGIGGVRLVGGQIDRHTTSFEPGHQIIDWHQPGKHLEDYVSGSAVKRETGQDPQEISDSKFWQNQAEILAVGLHNTILHWTPDLVILGGSMLRSPGIALPALSSALQQSLSFLPRLPEFKLAALADQGGLNGAFIFLQQKVGK